MGVDFGDNHSPEIQGDFNRDGRTDLAAVLYGDWDQISRSYTNNGVSIALSNSDGSFQQLVHYAAGPHPRFVAVGDFNGDGKPDLVVLNQGTSSDGGGHFSGGGVSLLLGDGEGSFPAPVHHSLDGFMRELIVDDFNHDGRADVAIGSGPDTPSPVSIFLGQSDGTLRNVANYTTDSRWASGIVAADFNGDGRPDLAIAHGGGIEVQLGNGDGTFQSQMRLDHSALLVAVGDFNNDGKADLVGLGLDDDSSGSVFTMLLGRGDGTFGYVTNAAVGPAGYPESVEVGDFNHDGAPDLLIGTWFGITALVGNGDGTFRTITLDVATAAARLELPSGTALNAAAITEPTFAVINNVPSGWYRGFTAVGDFNGDRIPDLVTATETDPLDDGVISNYVSVQLGKGDGFFLPPTRSKTGGSGDRFCLAVGDFNGDNKQDVAMTISGEYDPILQTYTNGSVSILLGNGDGTFQPPWSYKVGLRPIGITATDLNQDSIPDLAVANYDDGTVSILLGKGDGAFNPAVPYRACEVPASVVVGDFDADGKLDLAVTNYDDSEGAIAGIYLLYGNGDGTFQPPVPYETSLSIFLPRRFDPNRPVAQHSEARDALGCDHN